MTRPGVPASGLHVLHLEAGRHLYGGPRQVLELLLGLRAAGVGVTLACPTGSAIAAAASAAGLPVVTRDIGGDLDVGAIGFLTGLLRELRPDLLHVHSRRGADFFGGLAAALVGIPAILTRRVDNPDLPVLGMLRYRAYDRVVAISGAVCRQLEADGVPATRLQVIRSSVDAEGCQPTWPRERFLAEFGLEADAPVLAVVAQLIPRKGHELLLDAWPRIRGRHADARLLLFGSGPLEATLRRRAGTDAGIRLAGFRPDLRAFLGHVDLLVHPALREGLGIALLEAQAAGVPVVGAAAGGVPEAVADGETGLLVAPGDGDALAEAVLRLLANEPLRRQFGRAAAVRIRRDFSPAGMVAGYLALYKDVLAVGRSQTG